MTRHALILCCAILIFLLPQPALSRPCKTHQYWDIKNQMCRPCTKCPRNEIIRQPCGKLSNTICGPFTEFHFFNPLESSLTSNGSEGGERGWEREMVLEKEEGQYWRLVACVLMGVVCVVVIVATAGVLYILRRFHNTAPVKTPLTNEEDDSGYVVLRAIRPPNSRPSSAPCGDVSPPSPPSLQLQTLHGSTSTLPASLTHTSQHASHRRRAVYMRGTYKPKRRLLNYDADDVFESEDSSGSRTSRKLPLQTIPERSLSTDSEDVSVEECV